MAHHRIAIVTCSTRKPRLNPFISAYVHQVLTPSLPPPPNNHPSISLEILDIQAQNLPLFDEPGIPQHFPADDPTPHYAQAHTRAWSTQVGRFDAFIFVTPQYNRSVPASLKNALDYLFHEWAGKPAAVVSYGGRGGGGAAAHLKDILTGMRSVLVEPMVALTKYDVEIAKCEEEGGVLESRIAEKWAEEAKDEELSVMFGDLLAKLGQKAGK